MKSSKNNPKRKTALLSAGEHEALMTFVKGYMTMVEAAGKLHISDCTLTRVLLLGRGSPDTVAAIRRRLRKNNGSIA